MKTFDVRRLLSHPAFYSFAQRVFGVHRFRKTYVEQFLRPEKGQRILDLGCGPGDILDYLRDVDYVGVDVDAKYIRAAKEKFGTRGTFRCIDVSQSDLSSFGLFDLVTANGVLHHLNDAQVLSLLEGARKVLKPGGRLVTFDPCFSKGQSPIAHFFISKDRGDFVRDEANYLALARQFFPVATSEVRHGLLRIPYTHIFMNGTA